MFQNRFRTISTIIADLKTAMNSTSITNATRTNLAIEIKEWEVVLFDIQKKVWLYSRNTYLNT
jgi:hypothetical protein